MDNIDRSKTNGDREDPFHVERVLDQQDADGDTHSDSQMAAALAGNPSERPLEGEDRYTSNVPFKIEDNGHLYRGELQVGRPQPEFMEIKMVDIKEKWHTIKYCLPIDWNNPADVEAAGKWRQAFIDFQLAPPKAGVPWSVKEKTNLERLLKKRMEIPKIMDLTDYVAITNEHNKSLAGTTIEKHEVLTGTYKGIRTRKAHQQYFCQPREVSNLSKFASTSLSLRSTPLKGYHNCSSYLQNTYQILTDTW
jgi:hypothetical protein